METTGYKFKDYTQYQQVQENCYLTVRTSATSTMMQNMGSQVNVTTILRTCLSEGQGQHTETLSTQMYNLLDMGIFYILQEV